MAKAKTCKTVACWKKKAKLLESATRMHVEVPGHKPPRQCTEQRELSQRLAQQASRGPMNFDMKTGEPLNTETAKVKSMTKQYWQAFNRNVEYRACVYQAANRKIDPAMALMKAHHGLLDALELLGK